LAEVQNVEVTDVTGRIKTRISAALQSGVQISIAVTTSN